MRTGKIFDGFLRLRAAAVLVVSLIALTAIAEAQQTGSVSVATMSAPPEIYVIRNARIVTVGGAEIDNGTLVIRNGRIEAVGAGSGVAAPPGAREIDARGLTVYPGMMDAGTSLGLVEIGAVAATVDTAEVGEMNPHALAVAAVNPHNTSVDVTRVSGVTSVATLPTGGIISGQAAVINLNGTTPREMALAPSAALVIDFPRVSAGFGFSAQQQPPNVAEAAQTRDRQIERLRKMLRDAEAYGRAQDAHGRDKSLPRPDTDNALAALVPFVRGERPVIFRADRERDIRAAVNFASEMKLRPIVLGGNDAWKATTFLKERNVPVILTGTLDLPLREDDAYDVLYENAAKLAAAGVPFCISTGDTGAHVRDLPFHAGMAAAYGLPRAEALKAVTLYPARIMNVADRVGSIETGKTANLVITDGDLLEARTNVRHLFIEGRQIPLTSRHTQLYEQFKDRK